MLTLPPYDPNSHYRNNSGTGLAKRKVNLATSIKEQMIEETRVLFCVFVICDTEEKWKRVSAATVIPSKTLSYLSWLPHFLRGLDPRSPGGNILCLTLEHQRLAYRNDSRRQTLQCTLDDQAAVFFPTLEVRAVEVLLAVLCERVIHKGYLHTFIVAVMTLCGWMFFQEMSQFCFI